MLIVAQFAHVCNTVWGDEQVGVPMPRRRRFSLLLMGQGGSGKTTVVQEIVLPVIGFLFPLDESSAPPQSALMRAGSMRNTHMAPEEKAVGLHSQQL